MDHVANQIYRPNLGRKIPLLLAGIVAGLTLFAAAVQPGGPLFAYVWRVTMPTVSATVIVVLFLVCPAGTGFDNRTRRTARRR